MNADPLDELDYYALLRIEPDATPDGVRSAFHAFARRYHPDRHTASPEKSERAAQIYRRGAEAYRVLMDTVRRRAYDDALARGELRLTPETERASTRPAPPSGATTVFSPRARPFATKALQAFKAGDFKTAKLNLKMALAHEPDNALLRARLADVELRLRVG